MFPCTFSLFKLNFLMWHWLITLYRFQVCSSVMHICVSHCAHHPKSSLLPSPYIWSFLLFTTPQAPFPPATTTLWAVSMSFHLFVCVVYLVVHLLPSVCHVSCCYWFHCGRRLFSLCSQPLTISWGFYWPSMPSVWVYEPSALEEKCLPRSSIRFRILRMSTRSNLFATFFKSKILLLIFVCLHGYLLPPLWFMYLDFCVIWRNEVCFVLFL